MNSHSRRSFLVLLAGAAGMLALSGCESREKHSYRYRITVEVETPQGLRSGSSVWETAAVEGSGIPDTARRVKNRGEAVAVDLPAGTLFALLRDDDYGVDYPHYVVRRHLGDHPDPSIPMTADWKKNMPEIKKAKPSFDLYPDEYPMLVRFRDISDPASVEQVDPSNLAASFGPGVRLRRISVAVTEDAVTKNVEERLPWLVSLGRQRGTLIPNPPRHQKDATPIQLTSLGDFSTELYK